MCRNGIGLADPRTANRIILPKAQRHNPTFFVNIGTVNGMSDWVAVAVFNDFKQLPGDFFPTERTEQGYPVPWISQFLIVPER